MALKGGTQFYSGDFHPASSHLSSITKGNVPESQYEYSISAKGKTSSFWNFRSDPETKRKIRVASYKSYSMERKVKSTAKSGLRWLKNKYYDLQYRWF
ncbi:hypothetical protein O6H91_19G028000 [Diphasiastrum complanatum]|uniref:Uncharacterized protein n=1 Tax=Diphasiastrum complanatum TaxID=34168 RepID=A0ACC2AUG5_DIPCM|nr:hypothetical protein O6H91_19G028000 [Diphasiastrum complanatum]